MPDRDTLPDMAAPVFSPLAALRLAADGSPSMRELAREIGVSPQLLSAFESGRGDMGPTTLAKYAKAVSRTKDEIRVRWLQSACSFHMAKARELREELRRMGAKGRRGKRSPKPLQ